MPDLTVQNKNYMKQGGNDQVVASGGTLDFEAGTGLKVSGSDKTSTLVNAVQGGAGGYKIARGEVTLDGSNPTSVLAATTGLATVVAATVSLKSATTPGDDPSWLSCDYGGGVTAGQLDIYAWKNTGGTDPTLVASTNAAAVISWIAIGT